jgi:hypothetical protein
MDPKPGHDIVCTLPALSPPACSASELTSEIMNPFKYLGRVPWRGGGSAHHKAYTYTGQYSRKHASSWIRIRDPNLRVVQDIHRRKRSHWGRHYQRDWCTIIWATPIRYHERTMSHSFQFLFISGSFSNCVSYIDLPFIVVKYVVRNCCSAVNH